MTQITLPYIDVNSKSLRQWKRRASVALWKFTKAHCPIKGKLSGRELYIDADSLTNAIILNGVRPNASIWKGVKLPINRRIPTYKHVVKVYGQWREVSTKTKTVPTLGVPLHPVEYSKGRTIGKAGFFGLKRDGAVQAYGLTDDKHAAMPAFSMSIVEWLKTQEVEVNDILNQTFIETFGRKLWD